MRALPALGCGAAGGPGAQPTRWRYVASTNARLSAIQIAAVPNSAPEKLTIWSIVADPVTRAAADSSMLPMKRPNVPACGRARRRASTKPRAWAESC